MSKYGLYYIGIEDKVIMSLDEYEKSLDNTENFYISVCFEVSHLYPNVVGFFAVFASVEGIYDRFKDKLNGKIISEKIVILEKYDSKVIKNYIQSQLDFCDKFGSKGAYNYLCSYFTPRELDDIGDKNYFILFD
ncbi:hypothetical protein WAF17_00425 [Bernardetia sp. ABR2-2B]|uniref:hypothetical protein n=1 Tax=Bernardetia sp. ABR2-2B TaxID=3127472 RepID=UPI0030CDBC77